MKIDVVHGVVQVESVVVFSHHGMYTIEINTDQKWPKVFTATTFGRGMFGFAIHIKSHSGRGRTTFVTLSMEGREERRLWRHGMLLLSSCRYGPTYEFVPLPPRKSKIVARMTRSE